MLVLALVHSTSATHWVEGAAQIIEMLTLVKIPHTLKGAVKLLVFILILLILTLITMIMIIKLTPILVTIILIIMMIALLLIMIMIALALTLISPLRGDPHHPGVGAYTTLQVVGATYK